MPNTKISPESSKLIKNLVQGRFILANLYYTNHTDNATVGEGMNAFRDRALTELNSAVKKDSEKYADLLP